MMFAVPTTICPLLHDPPFVLWLCLLALAIGYRVSRVLRLSGEDVSRLERGVVFTGVGLGLLSNVALILGSLHILTPYNIGIALLLLFGLFSPDVLRVLRSIYRSAMAQWKTFHAQPGIGNTRLSGVPPGVPRTRISSSFLLLFFSSLHFSTFLLFPFLQSLCPCTDADGLAYHLRAPKQWLQTGSLDFLPTLTHTNSPMGVEMLYTLPLAVWSDTSAKLIHFALGLLTLLAVFAFGRRLHSARVGTAAALFFALGLPKFPVLSLFTYAYVDLGIALEVICATVAWFAWQRTRLNGWLLLSALCAGFAFAFKLTGAVYVLAFTVLTLWEQRQTPAVPTLNTEHRIPNIEYLTPLYVCIGCAPALPWLLRAWRLTGNPIYPLLPGMFPTRDWSAAHGHAFDTYMRLYNWGSGHTHWSEHFRLVLLLLVSIVYAASVFLLWRRCTNLNIRRLLLLAALPTLTAFATTGLYGRFLIPLLPLHALILLLLSELIWKKHTVARIAFSAWIILNGLLYLRSATPHIGEALRVVTGRETRQQYLLNQLPPMPLWNYANTYMRPEDRILVSGFGDTYYCNSHCRILKAFYQNRFRLDTWEHFLSDVQGDHISYLIVAPTALPVPEYGPAYPPADNAAVFPQRLARLYGQPLSSASDLVLYRLILPTR